MLYARSKLSNPEPVTMLVTPEKNRRNRNLALVLAGITALTVAITGWFYWPAFLLLGLCPVIYWLVRRRTLRRLRIMDQPFPERWEQILQSHVAYFRALSEQEKGRFRQLVQIFLAEVRITGIRTEVDDTVRLLVAASAVIPIFGFQDWEYHRLGEVLVYPDSFGENYQTTGTGNKNILGMVGLNYLSGVMILSKPSLLDGFKNPSNEGNVGVHEFVHLVEKEEVERGLPPEVPWQAVKQWVQYVAQELSHPPANHSYINDYAYTNEHEFLAVLAEYFFKSPELLQKRDPQLYAMLRAMFHQDTRSLLELPSSGKQRYARNADCPCGSRTRYKDCCLMKAHEATTKGD
jgi:MtfA peptidase